MKSICLEREKCFKACLKRLSIRGLLDEHVIWSRYLKNPHLKKNTDSHLGLRVIYLSSLRYNSEFCKEIYSLDKKRV